MSTATPTAPATAPPASPPVDRPPLWQKPIPVIGVTGERGTGKTRFTLAIAPGPDTCMIDTEDSSETYTEIGFKRIDLPLEMRKAHPNGHRAIDTFLWFKAAVQSIPPGRFRVIFVDVIEDVEIGLSDWVWENPAYFNHTRGQYLKMTGIFWGDVATLWKPMLSDIASRCETFVFAVHLGKVWSAEGKPTSQTKPKGKSVLQDLASLVLQMERPILADGSQQQRPSARVLKSRLAHNYVDGGRLYTTAILPPRLPEATPEVIRAYMAKPPDWSRLKAEELAPPPQLTDDQRLELRVAAATAEADTERMRLERVTKEQAGGTTKSPVASTPAASAVSAQPAAVQTAVVHPGINGQADAETLQETLAKQTGETLPATPTAPPPATPPADDYVRPPHLDPVVRSSIRALFDELALLNAWDFDQQRNIFKAGVLDKYKVAKASELTDAQAAEIEKQMVLKIRSIHAARGTLPPV